MPWEELASLSCKSIQFSNFLIPFYCLWLGHIPVSEPITDTLLGLALENLPAVSKWVSANIHRQRDWKCVSLNGSLSKVNEAWVAKEQYMFIRAKLCIGSGRTWKRSMIRDEERRGKESIYTDMICTFK